MSGGTNELAETDHGRHGHCQMRGNTHRRLILIAAEKPGLTGMKPEKSATVFSASSAQIRN
jgi:hypothetical protein